MPLFRLWSREKAHDEHPAPSSLHDEAASDVNGTAPPNQSVDRLYGHDEDLPRMRGFHLWHRKWSMLAYATFILMCNLALPCVLYYPLSEYTSLSDHALLGISSATLGISSSFDNPFRMLKLWRHRDIYGPLGPEQPRWYLDFTMHLYSFALFPIFAIPLAISSSVNPPMHDFFLMSTPMLVAVPGLFFLYSLTAPKCKFWMSSDPPGSIMKPGVFYLFEDIGAVDFRHGKEFRRTLHERYNASPVYRDLMWYETLFWAFGCAVYFAMVAGIAWAVRFDIAFGLVLGLLFAWMVTWSVLSIVIAKHFHKKEETWLAARRKEPELAAQMTREGQRERRQSQRSHSRPKESSVNEKDYRSPVKYDGRQDPTVRVQEGPVHS